MKITLMFRVAALAALSTTGACMTYGACEHGQSNPTAFSCENDVEPEDCAVNREDATSWVRTHHWVGRTCQELGYTLQATPEDAYHFVADPNHDTPGVNGYFAGYARGEDDKWNNSPDGGGPDGRNDERNEETCPPKGSFIIKIDRPSGACNADNIKGALHFTSHSTRYCTPAYNKIDLGDWINRQYWQGSVWTYPYGAGIRVDWQVSPDLSSWPTSCNRKGSSEIRYDGEVQTVHIRWD